MTLERIEGWLEEFPMFDWVGGRTSEMSSVGLLSASHCWGSMSAPCWRAQRKWICATRVPEIKRNPAALLALAWYYAGNGKGEKDMVVLPYKDALLLFSRYLQQLVMESLGKEKDLDGNTVHQGLTVYGNKGSTDQHAYVQQLREGVANFFVTFIEVLEDRAGPSIEVETDVTSGDFLSGFLQGTRQRAFREFKGFDYRNDYSGRCPIGRRPDRPLRARGWILCLPHQHQCLSSARCRSGQKGRRDIAWNCNEKFCPF